MDNALDPIFFVKQFAYRLLYFIVIAIEAKVRTLT